MKRSFDTSFVNSENSDTNAPHSFYQRSAPLATHYSYTYESCRPANPVGRYSKDSQPAPYLLHDSHDLDTDFQSNAWYLRAGDALSSSRDSRNNSRLAPPFAGLGIFLGPSSSSNTSNHTSPGQLQVATDRPLNASHTHELLPDADMAVESCADDAYSQCPSEDFVTHLPAIFVPYSPSDEFSMLVDSPAFAGAKMQIDSPVGDNNDFLSRQSDLFRCFASPDANVVGIFPDVNFRTLAAQRSVPTLCVNPADITGPGSGLVVAKEEEEDYLMTLENEILQYPASPVPLDDSTANFPAEAMSAIVSVLAASVKDQEMAEDNAAVSEPIPAVQQRQYASHPMPLVQLPAFPTRTLPMYATQQDYPSAERLPLPTSHAPLHQLDVNTTFKDRSMASSTNQLSPVLNAHVGIELDDLRQKAAAWRALNPGLELDKVFLHSFAGRLSENGELIAHFRCYVKGCGQSNKRRDHILVHVGSHVEHRPFECDTCGMRFLRKNECKRHTSSHTGFKPYACSICPMYLGKSFVRQDLLKRHMKVTHGAGSNAVRRKKGWKREESLSPISEYQP
ncbi:hypothetical protein BC835DRAFT_1377266 [Cytidiella melzeri]|nr:hypothetical protein BC835DRAFT_1377266 [Cytidiella melzeri]